MEQLVQRDAALALHALAHRHGLYRCQVLELALTDPAVVALLERRIEECRARQPPVEHQADPLAARIQELHDQWGANWPHGTAAAVAREFGVSRQAIQQRKARLQAAAIPR